jgi:uncharacterized protein with PIN domain
MSIRTEHLNEGDSISLHINNAGVMLHIVVTPDMWTIDRMIDGAQICIYEESKRKDGQWFGMPNPLAIREVKKTTSKCDFCNKPLPGPELLAADGWIPSYWSPPDDEEIYEPVCGECVSKYLVLNEEESDFETKPRGVPISAPAKPLTLMDRLSKWFRG